MRGKEFITGTGQVVSNVHPRYACRGEACVVHAPSSHSMRGFPTHFRGDRGITERICPHGIGHPDPDDMHYVLRSRGREEMQAQATHGCDGCCLGAYENLREETE
jgi:hypothetical protein